MFNSNISATLLATIDVTTVVIVIGSALAAAASIGFLIWHWGSSLGTQIQEAISRIKNLEKNDISQDEQLKNLDEWNREYERVHGSVKPSERGASINITTEGPGTQVNSTAGSGSINDSRNR